MHVDGVIEMIYIVALFPPIGKPRVIEMDIDDETGMPFKVFRSKKKADEALEAWLEANPEYRHWMDGRLLPPN